jgi:hypothetical protein
MIDMRIAWRRIVDFFFAAQSNNWLTVLRVGLAVQVLLYCVSMRSDWSYLLAGMGSGLIGRELSETVVSGQSLLIPTLGWLVVMGKQFGLTEFAVTNAAWICLVFAACFLLVGLFSRTAAIMTWFLHLASVKSAALLAYGMDDLTTVGLFYLMISPLPDRLSLDRFLRRAALKGAQFNGLLRRVLQIHLCIIYFFSGLSKCFGPGWWNGDSLWRALTHPPFNLISPQILVQWRHFFPFLGISVWVVEIAYPAFIWSKRTRKVWLLLTIGMHVAIGVTMGMYLFALVMIVLNVAAFGPDWNFAGARQTLAHLKLRGSLYRASSLSRGPSEK